MWRYVHCLRLMSLYFVCVLDNRNQKLTAGTQTEPVPTRIDRIPLDVPADTHSAVGPDTLLAVHPAVDSSTTEVPFVD